RTRFRRPSGGGIRRVSRPGHGGRRRQRDLSTHAAAARRLSHPPDKRSERLGRPRLREKARERFPVAKSRRRDECAGNVEIAGAAWARLKGGLQPRLAAPQVSRLVSSNHSHRSEEHTSELQSLTNLVC